MKTKNIILVKFGQNMRSTREAKGLSQEELAFRAGLDRTYIGGVERGERNVRLLNICRISTALDIATDTLIGSLVEMSKEGDHESSNP